MAVTVVVPASFQSLCAGQDRLDIESGTIAKVLDQLGKEYPQLRDRIFDASGLRSFVRLAVNGEDIALLDGLETSLADGDELRIVSAIVGG